MKMDLNPNPVQRSPSLSPPVPTRESHQLELSDQCNMITSTSLFSCDNLV